ncbi:hypothetical protein RRG08_012562 [Elysia crispata]|uniref:Uncharacterized protein n=1 Tax=Elysia crispata TaxID=231223 RepID=A0AAE1API9_9GAST|nr:hypothetical protein RRG08_012562 [Elysia crispata]
MRRWFHRPPIPQHVKLPNGIYSAISKADDFSALSTEGNGIEKGRSEDCMHKSSLVFRVCEAEEMRKRTYEKERERGVNKDKKQYDKKIDDENEIDK